MTEQSSLMPEIKASVKFILKPERTCQKVLGFGGAFTEAAAYAYGRMKPELREEILRKYFDPQEGIGYSLGRIHMNSCDFSLGNYTYIVDKDENLETFDISREDERVVPFIRGSSRS